MKKRTRGDRVIAFVEAYCLIPEGEHVGKPMRLEPFQKKFIREVYDNPLGTRRAYLSIARKNGKTGLIAGILLAHIAGPEARLNSQVISGAQSRDQAALVFSLAAKMVQMSDKLSKLVRIVPSGKRLIGLARNVEFRALAAEGKTAHGLSPVLAILDEVGQVRGPRDDFVDAIITSQGAHADPLLIAISTQSPNDADLFSIWLDDAKESKDRRIVSHVYEAAKDCPMDDPKQWKAANPAMGKFRSRADVKEQAERAVRMPSFEPTFRNLVLNQRVEMVAPFISSGIWLLNSHEPDPTAFYECPVYCGLDLSGRADLTALVMVAFRERWHVRAHFWTPEKGIAERSRRDRAPYDVWHDRGLLHASPGASIDYEHVARDMADILADCDVQAVAFDRWRFDLLKKEMDEIGMDFPLVPFGQGFKDMSPALETLESALLNEQMAHGAHPVLTMCAANSRVERDAAGNRKLSKGKATGRIDGMVALAMAIGAAASASVGEGQSFWEVAA
ncbi:MAG: terminase large subunit [Sulfuricaulis sp.]|nr:terminase large subunit [Sulfuricaulis sp.]